MTNTGHFPYLRTAHILVVGSALLSALACGASRQAGNVSIAASPALTPVIEDELLDREAYRCAPDESVLSQGGRYSTNVDLTASVALPGESGVDVVMTRFGAIAAVNTQTGSSLYWINPETGETRLTKDFSSSISDIASDGDETIAIAASNSLVKLDAASGDAISEISLRGAKRVALASNGDLAAVVDKTVHLYDSNNRKVFSKLRDYTEVTDVEIISCDNNQSVYVTSFQNAYFTDIENKRNPVQIARFEALDFSGDVQWFLFSDRPETIKQNVADTRLYRVTLGKDGYLYIGGESAGTATIFRWNGQPMTEQEQYGRVDPFVTRTDNYTRLHNSGSAHIAYYARVHPTKGELVTSQLTFPRLADTKSNTMRIGDIAASENGTLYFGGVASSIIPNRETLTINGAPVGEYVKRDRAWLSVSPNFRDRNFWTVLSAEAGQGIVQGVDAGYGYSAALSNAESGTVPVTTGAAEGKVFLSFTEEP